MALDEEKVRLAARLAALDYLVAHLLNANYESAGLTEEAIERVERDGAAALARTTFSLADPAIGDLLAVEIAVAVQKLLRQAKQIRAAPRT